jgi:RNA recognition motif-containing protein
MDSDKSLCDHEWESFILSTDDLMRSVVGACLCSKLIEINTDWISRLLDDDEKKTRSYAGYESEFNDYLEDRRLEISNFQIDITTEELVASICSRFGEIAWIDMTDQAQGKILVKFYDLRAAYMMKLSTTCVCGRTWFVQFRQPDSLDKIPAALNHGKIAIVPLADSVTTEMIHETFARLGPIREVRSWKDHRFVEFWDDRSCDRAIERFHGRELFGKKVTVNLSRPYFRHRLNAQCRDNRLPVIVRGGQKPKIEVTVPTAQPEPANPLVQIPKAAKPSLVIELP